MNYLLMFLSGVLLCNAIPHLVSGVRGERFFTPWSRDVRASAVENALWGSVNLLAGGFILSRIAAQNIPHGAKVMGIGFVLTAVALSWWFSKRSA